MKRIVLLLTFLFLLSGTLLVFAESTDKIDLNNTNEETVTSLNNLIQETITKNPILLSLGYQITAQGAKTKWIKVRPDPYISNSTNTHQYPFNYRSLGEDPMNQVQFVLGQDFPFPGKLKLKGKVETAELGKIKKDYDLTRLELTSRLKKSYYDLYLTTKSLRVIEDVKILLETLAGTVKAKYEVGEGNQQELLKVHLEISKLLQELETLKKDRQTFIAEINSIAIRPQGTNIDEIEDIKKQELNFSIDELLSESKNNYPLLLGQKSLIEKSEHGLKLAKKEYYPDYSVEGGYGLRSKPMDPMYMFQVMTSLPVYFRSKQRNQVKEANASLQAANENYNATLVEAEKKVKELVIEIEKNNTLINLLDTGIIPQARLTLDASIAAYKVNKTDFLNVLDNIRALLEFQINYYERLTDYEKAIAELEPLIGREL